MQTSRGLTVTTDSIQAIEAIDHFGQQILSCGATADNILAAAKNHPDNLLIQSYTAAFYLYSQENETISNALSYLLQAEQQIKTANLREKLIYQAIRAWERLDYECALSILTSVVTLFPRDTLALKFVEWLLYCSGQAFQAKRYLALCEQSAHENQDEPHFLAMHSFSLELCGHYKQAKTMAEQAIDMNLLTPWAHHTLGHVYLLQNDIEGGIHCLRSLQASWNTILPLMKGHNSWHLALFYLANRQEIETVKLFHSAIWGAFPNSVLEQLDAISLLWRLDMAGLAQDKLYQQIKSYLNQHPYEQYTGLNSVHFIYYLARIGDDNAVSRALKTIEEYIKNAQPGCTQNLWSAIILPFCKGTCAFVKADYSTAYNVLSPIIGDCFQMGGSDAQNEVFLQTYLLCLLGMNKQKEAKLFFDRYLSHYRNTPLAEYWFTAKS